MLSVVESCEQRVNVCLLATYWVTGDTSKRELSRKALHMGPAIPGDTIGSIRFYHGQLLMILLITFDCQAILVSYSIAMIH